MGILSSTTAQSVVPPAIGGALVYRKSGRGVVKLAANDGGGLSTPERHLLIMVDGRRTLAELSEVFGSGKLKLLNLLAELEAKGLVKRVDPQATGDPADAITQFGARLPEATPAKRRHEPSPPLSGPSARDLRPAHDAAPARFFAPAVIPPRRELAPAGPLSVDENPLPWLALLLIVTIGITAWLANRFQSEVDHTWWADYKTAQPIDRHSAPTTSHAVGADRPDRQAPTKIAPGSHLAKASPAVNAPRPPARAPSRAVPHGHPDTAVAPAIARAVPTPAASLAHTPAARADVSGATASAPSGQRSNTEVASTRPPEQSGDWLGLRPLRQDPPRIPEKAVRAGILEGHVQVRLWVTPEGKVDQVDVLEASPPGVLDDEVRRVLSLWTFEPPGHPADEVVQLSLEP
jgi:TonB family protein